MKSIFLLSCIFIFSSNTLINKGEIRKGERFVKNNEELVPIEKKLMAFDSYTESLYDCLQTPELNFNIFQKGMKGYYSMKNNHELTEERFLTLIDYTKPSNEERFFVVDLEQKQVIFQSIIAHGRNSGELYATKFSNKSESKMSSFGFFVTGKIYDGKYDHSMKLHGKEYSNSNVFERGVVVHSADYATKKFLKSNGNILGRSFGCPALPHKNYKKIVNTISQGSCFFIYHTDKKYLRSSNYLKARNFADSFYSDFG